MMLSHFEDLRRLKAYRDKRSLPIRTISAETGLSQGTILRVKNLQMERVYLSTLETLCRYFEVKSLAELMEFVADGESPQGPSTEQVEEATEEMPDAPSHRS